jgi:hypothetical protein
LPGHRNVSPRPTWHCNFEQLAPRGISDLQD